MYQPAPQVDGFTALTSRLDELKRGEPSALRFVITANE